MGIAWLLLQRTFSSKPKRTLLFLLGYALATAVMVTLLAVGEAVLQQARDKDLLGGGDLILVPQGIDLESMKVGGLSALYYSIPQARFIVRQVLNSSRFENEIDTVSPYIVPKLLYARKARTTPPVTAFTEGSLPDQENRLKRLQLPWKNHPQDENWLNPPAANFYHEIDRFHLPSVESPEMDRWAEWHYFNFESPSFYGYLSIMAAGNVLTDQAEWIVSLQLHDDQYRRHSATFPVKRQALPLKRIDYSAGTNRVKFVEDHYQIDLEFRDPTQIRGSLRYYPAQGLYFPPTILAQRTDFESGYVIPAIRGKYQGEIQIGNKIYSFDGIDGYHDHNWGIWRQIEWNWGHAFSGDFAIFFGEIFLEGKTKGLFAGVYDKKGFVTLFRPTAIAYSDPERSPGGLSIPQQFEMAATKQFTSLKMKGRAERYVTTPLEGGPLHFVQYKMKYDVDLTIDGQKHRFTASGNAETFVNSSMLK
jgi:hypothetical protein